MLLELVKAQLSVQIVLNMVRFTMFDVCDQAGELSKYCLQDARLHVSKIRWSQFPHCEVLLAFHFSTCSASCCMVEMVNP